MKWIGIVMSRAFSVGRRPPTLVGGIDCCVNHHSDVDDCAWFEHGDSDPRADDIAIPTSLPSNTPVQRFALRAARTHLPQSQIYHFYGNLGSLKLLASYGFIRQSSAPKIAHFYTFGCRGLP